MESILKNVLIEFTRVSQHGTKHKSSVVMNPKNYYNFIAMLLKQMRLYPDSFDREFINQLNELIYGK